jgi:hypothetical protein
MGFWSLGQKVVLMNNLGAIASYAATRKSYAENNRPMMKYLMESLADNRNPWVIVLWMPKFVILEVILMMLFMFF